MLLVTFKLSVKQVYMFTLPLNDYPADVTSEKVCITDRPFMAV